MARRPKKLTSVAEVPSTTANGPHDGTVILVVWQTFALALQVGAVLLALRGNDGIAEVVSVSAFALAFASALWVLTRPHLTRAARNTAVVCLGITPALMWHAPTR